MTESNAPKAGASWTVVDEYAAVVRTICHDKNYDSREEGWVGQDRARLRRFIAESRAIHTVQVQGHYSWQPYETRTLPKIRVDITIDSGNLTLPVQALKWAISTVARQYSKKEEETYTLLQEDFVNALLDAVDEKRKKFADDVARNVAGAKPTVNQMVEKQIETKPAKESKMKRIFGLRVDYLSLGLILGILISIASLFLFPEWARTNLTLIIVFPFGFAAAMAFIANFRQAYQ